MLELMCHFKTMLLSPVGSPAVLHNLLFTILNNLTYLLDFVLLFILFSMLCMNAWLFKNALLFMNTAV